MQIHTPTVVQGGETVDGNPLVRVFYMLHYFETIFPSVKAFDVLYKMRYILWVVALLRGL